VQTCMSDPGLVTVLGWLTSRPARGSPFTPGSPTFGLEGLVATTLGHACLRCDWIRIWTPPGRNHNGVIATRWDRGVSGAIWMRLSAAVLG
jgi:hypothetical protein